MTRFRRFIISLSELMVVILIFGATIFGAVWLHYVGIVQTNLSDLSATEATDKVIALTILGGVIGFVISGMVAAMFFATVETAQNTRAILERMRTPQSAT
jgi:uncharacterized BrkB/YihY/UPF0761 family membrane protein